MTHLVGKTAYVRFVNATDSASRYAGPVTITGETDTLITIATGDGPDAPTFQFFAETYRLTTAPSQVLIPEGTTEFPTAAAFIKYADTIRAAERQVMAWEYEKTNVAKTYAAADALRALAATPTPSGW